MIGININATTAEESEKIKAIEKVVRDAYEILTPQNKEFSLKDIKDSIVKTGDTRKEKDGTASISSNFTPSLTGLAYTTLPISSLQSLSYSLYSESKALGIKAR